MATIHTSVEGKRGCGYRQGGGLYLMGPGQGMPCGRLPIVLDVCPTCGQGIKPSRGFTWVNPTGLIADTAPRYEPFATDDCGAGAICRTCPLSEPLPERAGLLWIGEKFYKTPQDFTNEAGQMGVSRRISALPNDLKLGEDWVMLAHQRCVKTAEWPEGLATFPSKQRRLDAEPLTHTVQNGKPLCTAIKGESLDDNDLSHEREMPTCPRCAPKVLAKLYKRGIFTMFKPTHVEYVVSGKETKKKLDSLEKRGIRLVKVVKEHEQQELSDGE